MNSIELVPTAGVARPRHGQAVIPLGASVDRGTYDRMQVCLNGHKITDVAKRSPELQKEFCPDCGAKTIDKCPKCEKGIPGRYISARGHQATASVQDFCSSCGSPYPWLDAKVEGLRSMIDEIEGLSKKEKIDLKESAAHLVVETPKSQAASVRYKNALARLEKAGTENKAGAKLLGKFVYEISTTALKETFKAYLGN